ncbi:MAG: 30S ribosomal protein S18 [Candidatus Yanofskybacteria bacterium]|nr:30S ribosomal protein S18 [Candidatus Yanofskybacteria bacterium]
MVCLACQKNIYKFDYKNSKDLRYFLNQELEIKKGKRNNLCKKHQRRLAQAIKIARQLALLPFTPKQERKTAVNY